MLEDIKGGAEIALSRSINNGVSTGRTQAVKSIGEYLNLAATRIRQDFGATFNSTRRNLAAGIIATGQPVGLLNFGARQRADGWSVKVLRAGSRTVLKHAFKAKTTKTRADGSTYDTEHLWWRINFGGVRTGTGTKFSRYFATLPRQHFKKAPLQRLEGPRIEDIFAQPGIYDPIMHMANERVISSMDTEIQTILRRHNG